MFASEKAIVKRKKSQGKWFSMLSFIKKYPKESQIYLKLVNIYAFSNYLIFIEKKIKQAKLILK